MITKIIWDIEYRLTIEQDDWWYNPREDSNLWKILYSYNKHNLWDEKLSMHWHSLYQDFLHYINEEYNITSVDFDYIDNEEKEIIENFIKDNIVYLPVYLDYSWVSIQTTPFACRWDSWQVWYIYSHKDNIGKELILKEWEDWETKLKEILNAEIKYYDKYIRWEFYYYKVESRDILEKDWKIYYTDWEEEDSCWWLYELIEILDYNSLFTKEEIESCEIIY